MRRIDGQDYYDWSEATAYQERCHELVKWLEKQDKSHELNKAYREVIEKLKENNLYW